MKVHELMQREVFTVTPDDTVDAVFFLIHHEKIRHLPVVEKGRVVGIVSDRDLHKAIGPRGRRQKVVERRDGTQLYVIPRLARHIMRRGVVTIEPDALVGKAAATMARLKIGALPVVEGARLVGIITTTDLLRAWGRLEKEQGSR